MKTRFNTDTDVVIAVDLDGTLTFTDTLYESVLCLLRDNPINVLALPFWLLQGKAALKAKVAGRADLDITTLPYNIELIYWLKKERTKGKWIALCTAADKRLAQTIAEHLGLFDEVFASDGITNNVGANKRACLEANYGVNRYDYVGNSTKDLTVWAGARRAIVVNSSNRIIEQASQVAPVFKVFPAHPQTTIFSHWLKMLRVHNWLKNILLFVPLLAAHQIGNIQSLYTLILAFVSFSLCSSTVYILNDLIDLKSDRKHPRKQHRPFASCVIPIKTGILFGLLLAIVSLALGMLVGVEFTAWLMVYLFLTCVYSLYLKRLVLIDCFVLSIFYIIRIVAGAAAVYLSVSFWLIMFSIFIFISLAFVKRYAELYSFSGEREGGGGGRLPGRGYYATDLNLILALGVASSYISVLVFSLYLQSEKALALYSAQPDIVLFIIPIMLYWTSWIWINAHRGRMHDDPILFAVKDKTSLLTAMLVLILLIIATIGI